MLQVTYKTKAELAFEAKADAALRRGDYAHAEQVATWYDGYLRLVEPEPDPHLTGDDSRAIAAWLTEVPAQREPRE